MSDGEYGRKTQLTRESAKWLGVTFFGVGAAVFSGLSVTTISTAARGPFWPVVLGALAVPLGCALVAAAACAKVLETGTARLAEVLPDYTNAISGGSAVRNQDLTDQIHRMLPGVVLSHGGLVELDSAATQAHSSLSALRKKHDSVSSSTNEARLTEALDRTRALSAAAVEVAECIEYLETLERYRKAQRALVGCLLLSVVAIVVAGLLIDPARSAQSRPSGLPAEVDAFPVSRDGNATPTAGCLLRSGSPVALVAGSFEDPVLIVPARSLTPESPQSRCTRPVEWRPGRGHVVLVPAAVDRAGTAPDVAVAPNG